LVQLSLFIASPRLGPFSFPPPYLPGLPRGSARSRSCTLFGFGSETTRVGPFLCFFSPPYLEITLPSPPMFISPKNASSSPSTRVHLCSPFSDRYELRSPPPGAISNFPKSGLWGSVSSTLFPTRGVPSQAGVGPIFASKKSLLHRFFFFPGGPPPATVFSNARREQRPTF